MKYYYHDNLAIEIQVTTNEVDVEYVAVAYKTTNGDVITSQVGITENQALGKINQYLAEELHINLR